MWKKLKTKKLALRMWNILEAKKFTSILGREWEFLKGFLLCSDIRAPEKRKFLVFFDFWESERKWERDYSVTLKDSQLRGAPIEIILVFFTSVQGRIRIYVTRRGSACWALIGDVGEEPVNIFSSWKWTRVLLTGTVQHKL